MTIQYQTAKAYFFPALLLLAILAGGMTGYLAGANALYLKPLGDIFLNLIFTAIVPLIFFSVSSAIARSGSLGKLGKIAFYMTLVFLFTSIMAAIYALIVVKLFPPAEGVFLQLTLPPQQSALSFSNQLVGIFSVPEFTQLFSHQHILALIVFAILVGLAAATCGNKGKRFITLLDAGEQLFMRVFSLIMYYAPIGFFAYFAALVSELGPQLMESYMRIGLIYYSSALLYFVIVYTIYAYLAGRITGVKLFWKTIFLPATTAIATCSSAATIPANLITTRQMGISAEISETTIPLGTIIHKDGSVMGGMFKIAFLFGIFHLYFAGATVLLPALGVSLLVGTVMGAIPSGGMLGELLILSVYGFPASALMAIAAISIIIDPLATMLNATGNSVSTMLIARLVEGKDWFRHKAS